MNKDDYKAFRKYLQTISVKDEMCLVESFIWTTEFEEIPLYISNGVTGVRDFISWRLENGV